MSERVMLEIPDDLLQKAKQTAAQTGQTVEDVLLTWLERSQEYEAVYPLIPGAEYQVFTPYGNEPAAQVLMDFLNAEKDKLDGE